MIWKLNDSLHCACRRVEKVAKAMQIKVAVELVEVTKVEVAVAPALVEKKVCYSFRKFRNINILSAKSDKLAIYIV